ncbi:MAG TPA: 23S rRNA (pseudouridine(1915)-N(3))-methyltransferase RlmH [Longimicrobiaceae bacterium]|jgi:23S rRNA (pseudouridine1915-N3)-methyltransferase|nr:23S rRNA (pseudouridine(1915)-N(3))-methyltransferase RlmH [Longimicrobiaceae bacterium]
MKLSLLAVGKVRGPVAEAVADYESRIRRYFTYAAVEVKEESFRSASDAERVRGEEGKRLLAKVGTGMDVVALHRGGTQWSSERLSAYLADLAVKASPGAAFVIGGAFGLSDELLARATHKLSISAFTLPHELARLMLTEQIYRAGTIARGEPYHKGRDT